MSPSGGAHGGGGGGGGSIGPTIGSATTTTYAVAANANGGHGSIVIQYDRLQPVAFASTAPTESPIGTTYTPTATGGSGPAVEITIDAASAGACRLDGGVVRFERGGTCVIDADQGATADHLAGTARQSITVSRIAQTIAFTSAPPTAATALGMTYTPTASSGASIGPAGGPVAFSIAAPSNDVCVIVNGVVSFLASGTCTINADQAGTTDYLAADEVQQSFAVGRAAQAIAFTSVAPTSAIAKGATYAPSAIAPGGSVGFSIAAASAGVCTIDNGVVSFLAGGTCTIEARQGGNAVYLPAEARQDIAVSAALASRSTTTATGIATTFTASGPGTVRQTGTAVVSGRGSRATTISACRSTQRVRKAGKVTLNCPLTRAAKAARRKGTVTISLTTEFTPTTGAKAVSVTTIRLAKAKAATSR